MTESTHKNRVELAGVLWAEPVVRATTTGKKVCHLKLETKSGARTEFHRVVLWEGLTDKVDRLHKGDFIEVVGRLSTRSWGEGAARKYQTEIVASEVVVPNLHGVAVTDADIPF
jgi:single-stranded DNA-binding protein